MKTTLIALSLIASFAMGIIADHLYSSVGKVHITQVQTDERGYISVQFTQDGQEFALDYLTQAEFNDLIK